jgi:hypothetical protein
MSFSSHVLWKPGTREDGFLMNWQTLTTSARREVERVGGRVVESA